MAGSSTVDGPSPDCSMTRCAWESRRAVNHATRCTLPLAPNSFRTGHADVAGIRVTRLVPNADVLRNERSRDRSGIRDLGGRLRDVERMTRLAPAGRAEAEHVGDHRGDLGTPSVQAALQHPMQRGPQDIAPQRR